MNPYLVLLAALLAASPCRAADDLLEEVVVTAEFRPVGAQDLGASVSVFSQDAIERRGAVHLEQLLNLAPNVNFATGASRGRFIQIRGTGERSQFVEPINPSVGLLIDGMDFTGIAGAALALDIEQVEILRGPQGTLFGANALAGLVNMVSTAPGEAFDGRTELQVGNRNTWRLAAAMGGPVGDRWGFRLAAQANRSDGFIDNRFLGRPTNDIDERAARGRLNLRAGDRLDLELVVYLLEVDNGYDAFSLDNTRDTLSDEPGYDRLDSAAASLRARWTLDGGLDIEALLSHVEADTAYAYDEDWSHPGICDGTPCDSARWGFDWWYRSVDRYARSNRNTTLDLRLLSAGRDRMVDWVVGAYRRDQSQTLQRDYTFATGRYGSRLDTANTALYGQAALAIADAWTLVAGLRQETRDWAFDDNTPEPTATDGDEHSWGGRLALEYRTTNGLLAYALASRGYKAGGINTQLVSQAPALEAGGIDLPAGSLGFEPETMWNYELGLKGQYLDQRLRVALSVFHQERDAMQVKQSLVIPAEPGSSACPCAFIDSFQNASGGINRGLELEVDWQATPAWRLFASLGLLHTEYRDYRSFAHAEADPENGVPYDLSGRAQAHAPKYQYNVGALWRAGNGWFVQADVQGKDGFYASANHQERTQAVALFNLQAGYETARWSLTAWGRNLGDEQVQTRGFGGFGNDPRTFYAVMPYYQLGEPRVYGLTGRLWY